MLILKINFMIMCAFNKFKWLFFVFLIFINCKKSNDEIEQTKDLFTILDQSETGIDFQNLIIENEGFNILNYEYLYNGGGVAVGDINNDGLLDLYYTSNLGENKLYLNQGDFKFKDISDSAGVTAIGGLKTGVTMIDINQDGYLDIYICRSADSNPENRKNLLFINNKNNTFTEQAYAFGLDDAGYGVQAYFFDFDKDGDLDLYVLNHPERMTDANVLKLTQVKNGYEISKPVSYDYISDRLYINDNGKFYDKTAEAGLLNEAFGLSAIIYDFNNDQLPDIYICNDYVVPDQLMINKGNNTFENQFDKYFKHCAFSAMGSDIGDINNDGCLDMIVIEMLAEQNDRRKQLKMQMNHQKYEDMIFHGMHAQFSMNTLYLNSCMGHFSNIAWMDKVAMTDWSWSPLFGDFDNDGLKDIFVSNGFLRDITNLDYARYKSDSLKKLALTNQIKVTDILQHIPSVKTKSYFFKNSGDLGFKNVSDLWNVGEAAYSNGAVYADLNNDGFLDIVTNNINDLSFIYKNNGKTKTKNNFLSIKIDPKNRGVSLGATAKAYLSNGEIITDYMHPTRGFLSSSQQRFHFGIKEGVSINKIEIIWTDNTFQEINQPPLNQIISITKNTDKVYTIDQIKNYFFENVSGNLPETMTHKENDFMDFKRDFLLHQKYSQEGPAVAVADVNGDDLEDIYLGSSVSFAPKLFLQNKEGTFILSNAFSQETTFEDVNAIFFDSNNNGFQDLYVVSGGNEFYGEPKNLQDRLYINDGKGNFTLSNALPEVNSCGSVVKVHDIDGDGYLDIFVGGRMTPGKYPETPRSYLLKNNKGKFEDYTFKWSEDLSFCGMVTDASFADLNKNGKKELVIVGEWMPISIYEWQNGKYMNTTKNFGINELKGWWQSLLIDDFNGDGYPEIVAGNLGLNSFYKASTEFPITIHYNDFDKNGSIDPIISVYENGKSYPVHHRDRLLQQMIVLKKKYTRYHQFASATIHDLFTPEMFQGTKMFEANLMSHSIFINEAGKSFKVEALPYYTQISMVKSIKSLDINNDGKKDLLIGGNFYATDAEYGRYDASVGALLLGIGDGTFKVVEPRESNFVIPHDVRHIVPIKIKAKTNYLIVNNNNKCQLFKPK